MSNHNNTWQDEYYCTYSQDGKTLLFANDSVKEVVVRERTETIAAEAFAQTDVEYVYMPEWVSEIGARAFYGCTRLRKVVMPLHVKSIGAHAFDGCNSLRCVFLPKSAEHIAKSAFSKHTLLITDKQAAFIGSLQYLVYKAYPFIWKYPKVALAKVPLMSATTDTNGFYPTLGTLATWWRGSELGNILDIEARERDYVLCAVGGSRKDDRNTCVAIDHNGNAAKIEVDCIDDYWQELRDIQDNYDRKYGDVRPYSFSDAMSFLQSKKPDTWPDQYETILFITGNKNAEKELYDMLIDSLTDDGPDDNGKYHVERSNVIYDAPSVHRFLTKLREQSAAASTNALCLAGIREKAGALHVNIYSQNGGCQDIIALIKKHYPKVEIYFSEICLESRTVITNDTDERYFNKEGHYKN